MTPTIILAVTLISIAIGLISYLTFSKFHKPKARVYHSKRIPLSDQDKSKCDDLAWQLADDIYRMAKEKGITHYPKYINHLEKKNVTQGSDGKFKSKKQVNFTLQTN